MTSIIGCSQGRLCFSAYDNVSTLHLAVDDALGGKHMQLWADGDVEAWAKFDAHVTDITEVFYPLCIRTGTYPNNKRAWGGFMAFHAQLRTRTAVPLWLSPTNGSQTYCAGDADAQQQHVFDRAVADGLTARTMIVPAASHPVPDGCHFDGILSTNVGIAIRDFLEA